MLNFKLLNTLLFGTKDLKKTVEEIKNTEIFATKFEKILLYAMTYNENLTTELTGISSNSLSKKLSDDDIINKFYNEEKNASFFGFTSPQELETTKNSIDKIQAKINTVKNAFNKLNIKTKELSKVIAGSAQAEKLKNEIITTQEFLNKSEMQTLFKILQHNIAKEQYIKIFKLSKLIADYIEENNTSDDGLAYKHAYDITVCFGGQINQNQDIIVKLQDFLRDKGFLKTAKPLHDAFVTFNIPQDKQNITLKKWQELINTHGKEAMNLFNLADKIEVKKANLEGNTGEHIQPDSLQEAKLLKTKISYLRAEEHLELAELALGYNLSEENFDKCLEIEKSKKTTDNLPNVIIHGKDINEKLESGKSLNEYHLVKLPINDPRAYILGHITACCQSVGGHSEECVIDGITKENNGFYVLLKSNNRTEKNLKIFESENKIDYKNFDIVGQGYAWLSKPGNLVFDSWENLRNQKEDNLNDDEVIIPILQEFVKQVCASTDIDRVLIGLGSKTPKSFNEFKINCPESILEGNNYGDADKQALLDQKTELTELQNIIKSKLGGDIEFQRIKQAELLINIIDGNQEFIELFKDVEKDKLNLLSLLIIYSNLEDINYVYLKSFLTLDLSKIAALIACDELNNALEGYKNKYFTFNDLKNLNVDKINAITGFSALNGHKNKYFTFNDLKNLNVDKINAITDFCALNGYKNKYFTFNDLKDLNTDKIKKITLGLSFQKHENQYFTFEDLKNLEVNLLELLLSDKALEGYKRKYFSFEDFKDLPIDKIKALVTYNAIKGYENKYFTFDDLKNLEANLREVLLSHEALEGYKHKYFIFEDFKDLPIDKIKALVTYNAINGYDNKYFTFENLKVLNIEKIQALTTPRSIRGYEDKYFTFNDFKDLNTDKIKALTTVSVIVGHKRGHFKFNDLKDLNIEKINALTSSDLINKGYDKYFIFDQLKGLELTKINILTSSKALEGYEAGYFAFDQLKNLDIDQLKPLMLSEDLREFLKTLEVSEFSHADTNISIIGDIDIEGF